MNPTVRSQGKVLITEDEFGLRRTLHKTLEALGFEITEASRGEQALQMLKDQKVDVVLLDINLPGMGGIEVCRRLRQMAPGLQILMLTVRDSEEDKVRAIDSGADDYITKPFSLPELAARIRAAVRRSMANQPVDSATISIGDIELDLARRIVRKAQQPVSLSPKEFDLLSYLMKHAGLPLTHAKLLQAVWGEEYGQELEYLRTFVYHLRKKLEDDRAHPQYLLTEPYLGYRFREPEERNSAKDL